MISGFPNSQGLLVSIEGLGEGEVYQRTRDMFAGFASSDARRHRASIRGRNFLLMVAGVSRVCMLRQFVPKQRKPNDAASLHLPPLSPIKLCTLFVAK
jgi:hypothetical protein